MGSLRKVTCIALWLCATTISVAAQELPDVALGVNSWATYQGGDVDSVDMTTGRLSVHIPIFADHSQRGKLNFSFSVLYSSSAWTITPNELWVPSGLGLQTVYFAQDGFLGAPLRQTYHDGDGDPFAYSWYLREASGSRHDLGTLSTLPLTLRSIDGTGILAQQNASGDWVVTNKDGIQFHYPAAAHPFTEDANGNQITTGPSGTEIVDTLGRIWGSGGSTSNSKCPVAGATAYLWTAPGISGAAQPYTICVSTIKIQTTFGMYHEYSGTISTVTGVVLPDLTEWTFAYDNFGDLTKITFPTGGSLTYQWTDQGLSCSTGIAVSRVLKSRTLFDGSNSSTWNYTVGSGITVVDPSGNKVVNSASTYCTDSVVSSQYYSAGTLAKTVATAYNYIIDPYPADMGGVSSYSAFPSTITTTWATSGQVSKEQITYDSGFPYTDENYNLNLGKYGTPESAIYGLRISDSYSDFGKGSPGPILRTQNTNLLALSNSNYLTANLLTLPSSEVTLSGNGNKCAETDYGYDAAAQIVSSAISEQHVSAPTPGIFGDLTSVTQQLYSNPCQTTSPTGTPLTTTKFVYDTGMPSKSIDPNNNPTIYLYSGTYYGAYPTTVTNAANQPAVYVYDFNTGLVTSAKDPNLQLTSFTYDIMNRLLTASYPDGGQSTITRQESSYPFSATLTKKITSSLNYIIETIVDGVGRVSETELTSDPSGPDLVNTTYDGDGRQASVTNPYRTSGSIVPSTEGTSSYTYDGLSRPLLLTKPDSSTIHTSYCGSSTLVTDEAMHWRRSTTDGLGRLIEVDEPNSTTATVTACPAGGDPIWITTYTYDPLNDLTSVTQGGSRSRSFIYDSLKRMTSSTNPEAGTVTYTYDADGNVLTKADARAVKITYGWDALNRMLSRMYSNGDPAVTYTYDQPSLGGGCYNVGHLTSMTDAAGSETSICYDPMGRELNHHRKTGGITKTVSYTYNLDGSLATLVYPSGSGRTITYPPNAAGQPTAATDIANGISYTSNGAYTPAGSLMTASLGSLNLTTIYNSRLQPCWIYETQSPARLPYNSSCTGTATAGTLLDVKYNFNPGTDNGNVSAITNDRDTTRSQAFTYDQVNRVLTAQTPAPCAANCWSQSFAYDQWANLQAASATGTAPPLSNLGANSNNQVTLAGFSYDLAGNEKTDVTNTYVWNAENQIKTGGGVTYSYDGDGNRVMKSNGKIYWYGLGEEVLNESDASGNITDEYVYFDGKRISHRVVSSNSIYYYGEDMLGSSRAEATSTGTLCYDADFYPYGGEHDYTNTCAQNYKFMGKERDIETNNDNFDARYYSSAYGRFLSADWSSIPSPVPYSNLTNPQTLNLYAMVSDNPESFADLNGHCLWDLCIAEGTITVEVVLGAAALTTAYLASPAGQNALHAGEQLLQASGQAISNAFHSSSNDNPSPPPPPPPPAANQPDASAASGKLPPNWIEPTNAPQNPPAVLPDGHSVRIMPAKPGYPYGYWVQTNERHQPVNPATGKPPKDANKHQARAQTHVPLPPPPTPRPPAVPKPQDEF